MRSTMLAGVVFTSMFAHAGSAEVVHFVNPAPGQPGHYDWHAPAWQPPSGGDLMYLDITVPPNGQGNQWNRNSIGQTREALALTTYFLGGAGFAVASTDQPFVLALELGDTLLARAYVTEGLSSTFDQNPPGTLFPTGERRYIGVLTGDGRYGWIEVARSGASFAAFSWAYETVPGIPIAAGQVPAPGATAVLAGFIGLAMSHQRKS